jgi:hypothetical protein
MDIKDKKKDRPVTVYVFIDITCYHKLTEVGHEEFDVKIKTDDFKIVRAKLHSEGQESIDEFVTSLGLDEAKTTSLPYVRSALYFNRLTTQIECHGTNATKNLLKDIG